MTIKENEQEIKTKLVIDGSVKEIYGEENVDYFAKTTEGKGS